MTSKADTSHEIKVAAQTEQEAFERISGGQSDWTISRTEQAEYVGYPKALAVCRALGSNWTPKPMSDEYADCNFYLVRDDGLEISMNRPNYDHKKAYSFWFSRPRYNGEYIEIYREGHRINPPSINCGESKTPEQMAKDITRRLLPEAETQFAEVNSRIAARIACDNKQLASLKTVCAALGCAVPNDYYSKKPRFNGHESGISFEVRYDGSVTLSFSIEASAEKIAAIAKLVNE